MVTEFSCMMIDSISKTVEAGKYTLRIYRENKLAFENSDRIDIDLTAEVTVSLKEQLIAQLSMGLKKDRREILRCRKSRRYFSHGLIVSDKVAECPAYQ